MIIEDPDYERLVGDVQELHDACIDYNSRNKLVLAPNYIKTFFYHRDDNEIEEMEQKMENIVEELSNTRSAKVLQVLNNMPILYSHAHVSPFHGKRNNVVAGILFPVGVVLWIRIWRFRLRLLRDLKQIRKCTEDLQPLLNEIIEKNKQH